MTNDAVSCPSCGAKIRADRERCPRCRTRFTPAVSETVASAPPNPASVMRMMAAVAGAIVVLGGGLWLLGGSDSAPKPTATKAVDPLAARRRPATEQQTPAPQPTVAEPARPFMDASGAGASAYASGNYESALEQYQKAIEKDPDDAESQSNLGQVLVRLGRVEEALPHYERAIALIPRRWAYRFNLARAQGLLGRWDEAIANYEVAQQLFPDDYATTFNLALALHKKGNDAAAIEQYQKAIALAPDDASFRFALALSYERLQRRAEAAAAYQDYLRLAPQAGDAEQVRQRIALLTSAASAPPQSSGRPDSPSR